MFSALWGIDLGAERLGRPVPFEALPACSPQKPHALSPPAQREGAIPPPLTGTWDPLPSDCSPPSGCGLDCVFV